MSRRRPRPHRRAAGLLAAALLAGCGSSASHSPASSGTTTTAVATTPATGGIGAAGATPPADLTAAEQPLAAAFPAARGRSLRAIAAAAAAQVQLGLATGTFTPGSDRIAFGLTDARGGFVIGPSAVYVAASPTAPARGPFPAPADSVTVAPQYRSRQNAGPGGLPAIYEAQVPLPAARTYAVLVLTRAGGRMLGATGEVAVAARSPIPAVGALAPRIATDTPASTGGRIDLLTTRVPPDDMHAVSLRDVLGRRPVALLFATPQLCQSRVCGPVTDIAVSLEPRFRSRLAFIHEEVYVRNDPTKGLRPQMRAFGLQTEPWLFVIDRHGRIAARLEGAFGVAAVTRALEAGLR